MTMTGRPQAIIARWRAEGGVEWRCWGCDALIGFVIGGDRFVTYHGKREIDVLFSGARQVCEGCASENIWTAGKGPLHDRNHHHHATPAALRHDT